MTYHFAVYHMYWNESGKTLTQFFQKILIVFLQVLFKDSPMSLLYLTVSQL